MYLSPSSLKSRLQGAKLSSGGIIRCPESSLPSKYRSFKGRAKQGKHDNSVAIFIYPRAHNGFRVHSHRDGWQDKHAEISELLGLEPFRRTPRKPGQFKPSRATFQLLGESNTICLEHGANDAMFAILVSDYRMAGHTAKSKVKCVVDFLGKSDADFERAWAIEPRKYTAQERAAAHCLPYVECRRLNLFMSGCADKSQEERRRITLANEAARKRVKRAEKKARKVIRQNVRAALERVKEHTVAKNMATVKVSSLVESVLVTVLETKTDKIEQESVNPHQIGLEKLRPPPETMPKSAPGIRPYPILGAGRAYAAALRAFPRGSRGRSPTLGMRLAGGDRRGFGRG